MHIAHLLGCQIVRWCPITVLLSMVNHTNAIASNLHYIFLYLIWSTLSSAVYYWIWWYFVWQWVKCNVNLLWNIDIMFMLRCQNRISINSISDELRLHCSYAISFGDIVIFVQYDFIYSCHYVVCLLCSCYYPQ